MNADNNAIISFNDPTLLDRYSQEEIERQRQNYEAGKGAFTKTDKMVDSVVFTVLHNYDFVRVLDRGELGTIYFKPKDDKTLTYQELKPVLLERIITDTMQASYHSAPSQKVKAAMETLKVSVKDSISTVSNDLIELAGGYYWDTVSASIKTAEDASKYEYYDGKRYCFRRLFDSEGTSEIKIDRSFIIPNITIELMKSVLKHLEETEGDLYPDDLTGDHISKAIPLTTKDLPLAPFWTWANEDVETFNDLLKAVATNFMEHKPKGSFVLIGLKRNGKSPVSNDTPVLTRRNGEVQWVNHGDLRVGDEVMSWEGKFAKVITTVPYEAQKMYEIELQDGRKVKAAAEHIWSVVRNHKLNHIDRFAPERWTDMTTEELAKNPKLWYLPPIHPASLPEQDLPIDPYVLGIILGDACINGTSDNQPRYIQICGEDKEIVGLFNNCRIDKRKTHPNKTIYIARTNQYAEQCVALGIAGKKSYEKFIPEMYLFGSVEQRLALMAGLLDTDGYISHGKVGKKNHQVEFSTSSKVLAEQVKSLAFSLGWTATIHERMGAYTKDGERIKTRPNYRLFIRATENPFRLKRKASCWTLPKRLGYVGIKSIKEIGREDCQCIAIDAPSHLYVVSKDYIPTHNTFVKLLHTLFGRNNTSAVRLADFNNHGLNGELWTTMMNAPDEEDEATGNDILSVQTNFKSIAAHESLKLRKLYAQQGQSVNTDFMCFFPMNHFPEWKGSGAAACMQRTLPIFFDNDLSKYDNNGKDFVRETYTAPFFQDLLGVILAFAAYYHDRPLRFSDKMMSDQRRVSTTVDNVNTFVAQFMSYFRGYSKKGLVYQEYRNWCIERDLEPQSKAVLSTALELRDEKSRIFYENENDRYGERVTEIVHDDPSKPYFRMNQTIPELQHKTVESFLMGEKDQYGHYKNSEVRSVINALENLREKRLSEERINRSKGGEQ